MSTDQHGDVPVRPHATQPRRYAKLVVALITAIAALAVSACGSSSSSSSASTSAATSAAAAGSSSSTSSGKATGSPILVGNISSITGLGGTFLPYQETLKAYFKWLDANGGINGRPVDLLSADDSGDPATYASEIRGFIAKGIVAEVGDAGVGTAGAGAPLLEADDISDIGGWANGPEWYGKYPNFFLTVSGGATPQKCVPIEPAAILAQPGIKKVAVVSYNIPAGKIDAACQTQGLVNLGGTPVAGSPIFVAPAQADLQPEIQSIINSGAQGIILQTGIADMVTFIKTADQLGYKGIIWGGNGMSNQVLAGLGSLAVKWKGRIFGDSYAILPDSTNPQLAAFRASVPAAYKEDNYAVPAWGAGVMFTDAVKAVGTSRSAITKYMQGLDGYTAGGLLPPVRYKAGLDPQRCTVRIVNNGDTKWLPVGGKDAFSCVTMFNAANSKYP
jgi:ABC-type branched-subunit amino acid transport system substrate-binding protein